MVDAAASFETDRSGIASAVLRESASLSVAVTPATREALAAYAGLASAGLSAPAQSAAWIETWVASAAPDAILAIVSSGRRPVFALALEVVKAGPFRVARLMSGRHANGNFCAVDPVWLASARQIDFPRLFQKIAEARPDVDVISLERMLPDKEGMANPLSSLPHHDSPNLSLAVDLDGGFDELLARSSGKRKRKKHRSQTRKFETAGSFRRIEARTPDETRRLLDAFFTMKQFRFQKMGIADVFAERGVREFFQALFAGALKDQRPEFVLHGLEVAGTLRAVTGCSRSGNRIICEFGAIAEDDLAHTSPGDFLFFCNIEEACAEGLAVYDYSVGDEPYKRLWCDLETRHFDVVVPLSAKGRLLSLLMRHYAAFKSWMKSSPLVWNLTKALRRKTAGQPQPADD